MRFVGFCFQPESVLTNAVRSFVNFIEENCQQGMFYHVYQMKYFGDHSVVKNPT